MWLVATHWMPSLHTGTLRNCTGTRAETTMTGPLHTYAHSIRC